MNRKFINILNEYFSWIKVDLITVIVSGLLCLILTSMFQVHWFILFLAWLLVYLKSAMFFRRSSFAPTIASSLDNFSWKFIQSLPLTKKELVVFLSFISVFSSLPLLYTFIMSYTYLANTEMFASLKGLDLLKTSVNYIIILSFFSLAGIDALINYPRVEYRKKNNKSIIPFVETVLIISVIFVYFILLSIYTHKNFNIDLSKLFFKGISQISEFSTTWWFPLVLIFLTLWKFRHTLNLWKNEKSAYKKEPDGKKKWNKVVVLSVLLVIPLSQVDFKTPHFYQGSLINKAVYNKNYSEIINLINKNEDINKANGYGFSPMFVAIHEGDLKTIKFLEARGATYDGIIKKDTDKHEGFNALLLAIDGGSLEVVDYVLSKGFGINAEITQTNYAPIHYAAKKCNSEILDFLINKGANINLRNKLGQTAIVVAVENRCLSGSITLKEAGVRFDIADNKGNKIIDYLKDDKKTEFKYLIEKFARVPAALK